MTNRTRTGIVLLVLAQGLAGCDRAASSRGPTAPSNPPPVPPPTATIHLAGTVSDAAYRRLAGAKVEVVDGPQAGLSTTANGKGEFNLTGTFDDTTHFRATKEGHVAATWPLPPLCARCNPNWWIHFYLEAIAPHTNIAGDYTLTFIADSACPNLPDDARTRTYAATVTLDSDPAVPANSRFNVKVSGSHFLEHYDSFTIGVAGDYLATDIGDWGHGAPGLVELVAPNTYLTIGGGVATSVNDGSKISGALYGAVERCELTTEWGSRYNCKEGAVVAGAHCLSQNHQLILTRR